MKIQKLTLPLNKSVPFDETVDFTTHEFAPNYIKGIPECHVSGNITLYEDLLRVVIQIKAKVIGICAYTLEDAEINLSLRDELNFVEEELDDGCYVESGNIVDLDEYILALILAALPHKITKKGATPPKGGDGYRVLTEEELEKERSETKSYPFDALDSLFE
jgi:uncharacterized metal-binding protein YceD (DUF177 family)